MTSSITVPTTTSSVMVTASRSFRIALIQLGGGTPDKRANLARARSLIAKAVNVEHRPHMVVLPEVFNSPYGTGFFSHYAETIMGRPTPTSSWNVLATESSTQQQQQQQQPCESESVRMLAEAARDEHIWLVGGSIPERDPSTGHLYNTATVYSPNGHMVALHRKLHLFDIDIPGHITFRESDTLTAGQEAVTIFNTEYGKIGLGICYDIRFPEMAMIAARQGCIAMVYPGAFNLTTGPLHWELLARARAVDNQIYVATCSPARDMQASYHAWGHSSLVDPMGKVIATTDEHESIVVGTIDLDEIDKARASIPVTTQRRFDVYPDIAKLTSLSPPTSTSTSTTTTTT